MTSGSLESQFDFEELFFSKTDKQGTIISGNSVFRRVSEYSWDALINKPHNVIRHPDMPRGVFYLLWEYLKADQPIGAFVKNRSKSGKFYWVFALAMPIDDGYVSVRIKPGGELLKVVEEAYGGLRAEEESKKLNPQQSRTLLLQHLARLGFADYSAFMAYALFSQLENRCRESNTEFPRWIESVHKMNDLSSQIIADTAQIFSAYRALAVVATQYQKMAEEVNREIVIFDEVSKRVTSQIQRSQFLLGASQLLRDMNAFLAEEKAQDPTADFNTQDLEYLAQHYLEQSANGVAEMCATLSKFKSISDSIQTAQLSQTDDVLPMLNELKELQIALSSGLRNFVDGQGRITQLSGDLKSAI